MLDNNLILLIAIGVVVFLIMNLNSNKKSSRSSEMNYSDENNEYENFEQAPTPVVNQSTIMSALASSQPVASSPTPATTTVSAPSDALNALYNSNLKGSESSTGFSSNTTNVGYAADYNQGYTLGINSTDPALSKFMSQAPPQKTPLISDDLLPKKSENWFETPSVGTKIDDANLLADAIFKTGVDTVGSTRKNPSYDIRGNVPNPKFPVSPWNNSSYEPDNNLRGLCI